MRTAALVLLAAGGVAVSAALAGGLHHPSSSGTQVLGERATRPPAPGLSVTVHADHTHVRVGEPVHLAATWRDDAGQRLGWATLVGDEGASRYVKPTACPAGGAQPEHGQMQASGSYARPGTYTAYIEITTGGCGAPAETRRGSVVVTVTR